ncbi:MAG: M23 family metallopeptidase [Hyphomicrobiales bacterium]|nr:M23 family metallopeptidase [Hyphomicrobiales bacterium]MCP5371960.1 M23 family metallopeptidase [Hyphomicrobiales bacterium]
MIGSLAERLLLCAALLGAAAAAAGADPAPRFALPIDCTPYADCWPVNYVDRDPTPGWKDYRCGWHARNDHRGTDLAIADSQAMRAGVAVLAAAAGTVAQTRDGMEDTGIFGRGGARAVERAPCGNGVLLDHGGGWTTKYCHLRKGSVRVKNGQAVAQGQPLGLVGMSGMTELPHIHFQVEHDKAVVDPFVGVAGGADCAPGKAPLWRPEVLARLPYRPVFAYKAGFAAARPNTDAVRAGLYSEKALPRRAPMLVFWADFFWTAKGDRLEFRIQDPDGREILRYDNVLTHNTLRWLYFAGVRRKGLFWPAGTYRGTARVIRGDGPGGAVDAEISGEILIR